METKSLKIKQEDGEQETAESAVVARNRPDAYTASELFCSLIMWTNPIMDVLTWQLPIVTISWLILGLVSIYLVTSVSLLSLLGVLGLVMMGLVLLYAAIMRVAPYEELGQHPMLVKVRVSAESVDLVADRVTNWINRWLATGQHLIFGKDYRPSIMVSIIAFYLAMICTILNSSTVIMMAYCFAFIWPTLWLHYVRNGRQLSWSPGMLFKKQNLLLNKEILEEQEEIEFKEE